ncbi:radical SAM protein [Streptacidiphilus jiangxiensis]|uniref:Cyclic pyranopterin phosphate synthase n=1 Tax=Streptacidiphilus jiangxiensis TaxID=235985 RepID=A0A1H8BHS7_STRJI|nr:radical SAM protein [Streptacidiphilus jiangxiensis]SEM81548.1 cyclic pyranopterin phosphate synthase [Streptacidiphilus jiangxiensis]
MTVRVGMTTERERVPQFRVTVNSRCKRACFYCRPSGEAVATAAGSELCPDHLLLVAGAVRRQGVSGIKLTGGDPALYGPLVEVVRRLREEAGFAEIEVISRHPVIGERAQELAEAGVTLFNVSLDTLDPVLHKDICAVDDHDQVVEALRACVATGVPVKVNVVVMGGVNLDEVPALTAFCEEAGVAAVKLLDVIRDLGESSESFTRRLEILRGKSLPDLYAPLEELTGTLRALSVDEEVRSQGGLGHPLTVFTMPSGMEVVVKDSAAGAWYGSVCKGCPIFPCHDALMALRLTADGRLQFCLLREDVTVDLAQHLAAGDTAAVDAAVEAAFHVYADAYFRAGAATPQQLLEVAGR